MIKCESALFNVCLKTAGVWGRVWMSKVECVLCFQSSRRLKCVSKDSYIVWIVLPPPPFFFFKVQFLFLFIRHFIMLTPVTCVLLFVGNAKLSVVQFELPYLLLLVPIVHVWVLSLLFFFFFFWWSCHVSSGYSFFPSECCLVLGFERISKFTNLLVCCYVWELGKR